MEGSDAINRESLQVEERIVVCEIGKDSEEDFVIEVLDWQLIKAGKKLSAGD